MFDNFKGLLFLFLLAFSASAQTKIENDFDKINSKARENIASPTEQNKSWKLKRGAKELNIEIGYSPFQPTFLSGVKEYDTSGRSFALLELRWGRVIGTAKHTTFEY
jgi:hypothetical protein